MKFPKNTLIAANDSISSNGFLENVHKFLEEKSFIIHIFTYKVSD